MLQFTTLMSLLHKMLNQVDADRRHKMMREAPDDAMLEQRRQDSPQLDDVVISMRLFTNCLLFIGTGGAYG